MINCIYVYIILALNIEISRLKTENKLLKKKLNRQQTTYITYIRMLYIIKHIDFV